MKLFFTCCSLCLVLFSCKNRATDAAAETPDPETPVTVTAISNEPMEEYVELNATSTYLQKWSVKSNINGYLQSANVQLNKNVGAGQVLYTVKTKEAKSIGNTINILDSSFKFTGTSRITAAAGGFISQIDHQNGDYVQDGEQLAVITDTRSFVFLLDLPYELRSFIQDKRSLDMLLPDGEKLTGSISGNMPSMDSASQTQRVILKVNTPHPIPENLIAKVKIIKSSKANAFSLPKAAILTDETQGEFWIMKMLNDSIAVKIPVKKGIETNDRVEILSPAFSPADKVLVTGNYGLGDTARVKITNPEKKD
jgi:multidrug efflux pump subunit AcrA (membrane-fusion protein)